MKLVDLAQPFSSETPTWPYFPSPQVRAFHTHARDAKCSKIVETNMHTSTHIDAPYHFGPAAWDCAQIPLDRLYGTGLILDISDKVSDYDIITRGIVEGSVPRGERIRENDILILHTGWHRYNWLGPEHDEDRYFCKCPGPNKEMVDWCIQMKFKWVGVDCPSFEHALNTDIRFMRPDLVQEAERKFKKPIDEVLPRELMLYAHREFLGRHNQMMVENIAGDIEKVLGIRANIGAFPWKWIGGDASICRVVVFLED